MEEQSYTSTHPLGHTGPVTGNLYLYLYFIISSIKSPSAPVPFSIHIQRRLEFINANSTQNYVPFFYEFEFVNPFFGTHTNTLQYYLTAAVKAKLSLSKLWRHMGGVYVQLHLLFPLALFEDEWSASRPGGFTPGKDLIQIEQEASWVSDPVWTFLEKRKVPFPYWVSSPGPSGPQRTVVRMD